MNYERPPERLASLADEYALGTLAPRARRRFERVLATSASARVAVRRAEDRLVGLQERLAPVPPSPTTWDAIVARLGFATQRARPWWAGWRPALAAVVVALALGVGWLVQRVASLNDVARVQAAGGTELWVVAADRDLERLVVRATPASVPLPTGRAYELWALPDGGAPVSLGLLPQRGDVARELVAAQREALRRASKVAVSLEPAGGSPTGAPTGPVLFVATFARPG